MRAFALMSLGASAINSGMASCPCTSSYTAETDQYKDSTTGRLIYTNNQTNVTYHLLPIGYGLDICERYDENVPECAVSTGKPAWCMDQFCYVGPNCAGDDAWEVEQESGKGGLLSAWFPDSKLRYSYATCGTASYFSKYHAAASMSADELRAVPEQHVKDIVMIFEEAAARILDGKEGNQALTCDFLDSCDCPTCEKRPGSQWEVLAVDLRKTTVTFNQQERGKFEGEAKCLGRQVQSGFRSIAQQVYNDPNRIAYMYFGLQENGAMIQWPASQWCPPAFDARFRPWYATAASGPKDVVLTLDNSGSMMTEERWTLLKEGVVLVLRTLTEYDYLGVLLFSSNARAFKPKLMPATLALKEALLQWLNSPNQDPMGGTNFEAAFDKTFSFIKRSRANGATTRCQAAVLFMTDGEDTSDFDVKRIQKAQENLEPKVIIFTYTFGSGARRDLPENIACENNGVYWNVPDGGNIGLVMSAYYKYFASGVVNSIPRWVTYADALTGETLMGACLSAYRHGILLGVGCMDVNMLIRLNTLKGKTEYASFIRQVQASSSTCAVFDLSDDKLESIRAEAGTECSGGDLTMIISTVGPYVGGVSFIIVMVVVRYWMRSQRRQPAFQQHQQNNGGMIQQHQPFAVYQTDYGAQQHPYGAQQHPYGAQQNAYGGQQNAYGGQQNAYGGQQNAYGGHNAIPFALPVGTNHHHI
eukprot:GEMP01006763.1.p1 GENE.GEMP01006763.1~~GEMP01006763.1.p1  ORF type:complete len:701 (+),score=129.16 GEMP01006763.1:103-2205(+)